MEFYKYSGSGNDFIFLNNMQGNKKIGPSQVIEWCKRREGVGADGVVMISPSDQYDYSMRIYNADGSEAEMCGNASRCSVHFAKNYLGLTKKTYQFETKNGVYAGEMVSENEIKIKMTELFDVDAINISDLTGKRAMYLNTGVPHAVIQVSSVEDVNVNSIGRAIRNDERFSSGTNVDFFEVIDDKTQTIKLRVYERGVEDETLCCGTGIIATAVACSKFFGWIGEIKVHVRGGLLKAIVNTDMSGLFFQAKFVFFIMEKSVSERLDNEMLSRGIVKSRSQASMLIKQGDVLVNGVKVLKPGKNVQAEDKIEIKERGLYVSRGAYKLLKAIEEFKLDFSNKVVADCGASTGGFTQVALQNGASKVYAIDVGHDQLDQVLVDHPNVKNMEGINLKYPLTLEEKVDICVTDLSFISLTLVYPTIHSLLKAGGRAVVLIKPQFEAGRKRLGKGGLVKPEDQKIILEEVLEWFQDQGHTVEQQCESPIKGKTGNTEFLALIS